MKILRTRTTKLLIVVATLMLGLSFESTNVQGQFRSSAQTQRLLGRLETNTNRFSRSADAALDRSRLDDTSLEDQVNALVDELEFATDRLKDRAADNLVISLDVNEVLRRGMRLDMFMQRHSLSAAAERDWRRVRNDLNQLARAYNVAWSWVPRSGDRSALNRASTKQVIQRLEETADQFRTSFDAGLDRTSLDGSAYEDFMNRVVAQFERSVDRLEEQANGSNELNPTDIRTALNNAAAIDEFLRRQRVSYRVRRDWNRVKANLDDLAFLNQVAWDWTMRPGAMPVANAIPQATGERVGLGRMVNPSLNAVAREVRHELLSDLPYYSVFDWIEFEVMPDNTVILRGAVTTPPDTKSRAEAVVADVPGVNRVVNEIRALPVSPNDDRLRRSLFRAIYGFDSPLFRYGVGSRQSIHVIVEGGRATLKGIVDSEGDKQLAYARARGVPGLFSVTNELVVARESIAR
jgi:osmotically-inducible protein OsmY